MAMHEGLWRQVVNLVPEETARRAGCGMAQGRYVVRLLGQDYAVDPSSQMIMESREGAGFIEQLCILAYLIGAKDMPLSGRHARAQQLPGGDFFFRGHHDLPTGKLAKVFGDCPEKLISAGEQLGGQAVALGDAAVELKLLPQVPMTVVIWGADEEFEARATILFDATAGDQMALDALGAAANLAVKKLIESVEKE